MFWFGISFGLASSGEELQNSKIRLIDWKQAQETSVSSAEMALLASRLVGQSWFRAQIAAKAFWRVEKPPVLPRGGSVPASCWLY